MRAATSAENAVVNPMGEIRVHPGNPWDGITWDFHKNTKIKRGGILHLFFNKPFFGESFFHHQVCQILGDRPPNMSRMSHILMQIFISTPFQDTADTPTLSPPSSWGTPTRAVRTQHGGEMSSDCFRIGGAYHTQEGEEGCTSS